MDSGKFFAGSSMILLLIFIILYIHIYNLYLSCFFFLSFYSYYIYTCNNNNVINKNLQEMMMMTTPTRSSQEEPPRGKQTPLVSLVSPFLERVVEDDTSSGNILFFSRYQNIRTNPLFDSRQPSDLGLRRMSKKGHPNLASQSGFVGPTLILDGKSIGLWQGEDKRLISVNETQRKSQKVDLTEKRDKSFRRMIPHVVSDFVLPTSISKGGKPIESHKHQGQGKRLSSVAESRGKSERIGLVRKQHKQVLGTQRTITGVVPAQGRIPVVRSGFERPTLIQKDSKSIGSEKLQGPEKLLSSVVDCKKKSGNVDSSRMIPHVVSASLSQSVLPTSISKGGKPTESHKHKGQEKQLSSVLECRKKSVHIGLVRKQDKHVVRTQRTITSVVPAQGHIPVVRSGFERPTLIQKDSKSIGSKKLQGPKKLLSSVVESKKKFGNVDSSRKNDIKVVGTRKDLVDERSLQPVSKHNNVKAVPQAPPYKGRKINSISEHKARWKF